MAMRVKPNTNEESRKQRYRVTNASEYDRALANRSNLTVPDHTLRSRRAAELTLSIPLRPRKGSTHVVVDSTPLKISGKGEWTVRQHGGDKRRTWHKGHLLVDETTMEIIGIEVTIADSGDSDAFLGLLDQIEGETSQVLATGAYYTKGCHEVAGDVQARATIPARESILKEIEARELDGWTSDGAYHRAASPRT